MKDTNFVELPDEVRAFLESERTPCVISTLRADGHPITSATWYGFAGDDLVVATPAGRNKAKNLTRDPRISFIVDTRTMPYRGVAIEGVAELGADPDGAILAAIVHRYLAPDAAAAMLAGLGAERPPAARLIVRIRPQRVRPWSIAPRTAISA